MSLETIGHLAELSGRSRATITKSAHALGLRPVERGKGRLYESKTILPYIYGQTTGDDGESAASAGRYDFNKEKVRLTIRQREKIELDIEQRAGRLVSTEHVVHFVTNMIANCKARLLAIPTKIAPEAANMNEPAEIAALAKVFVVEALDELRDYDGSARPGE